MMILTAKLPKKRLIVIGLLLLVAAILLIVLFSDANGETQTEQTAQSTVQEINTNEDRIAFLQQYGYEVSSEPVKVQQVRIPTEPSDVFSRYNELQKSQGYDLEPLAGKCVNRYVYEITNYPTEGQYYATLLIYKDAVIGGDVSCSSQGGMMHGFEMPKNTN